MATRSSASLVRKADGTSEPADTLPAGDHRKRRRNRTSKSCINCRMAKRQCDRQRPACQRCISLGLTGLCAFELDDAQATTDPRDENARLRRRIAELERVIRELQRKPHPRWAPNGLGASTLTGTTLSQGSESDAENSGSITLVLPFSSSAPGNSTPNSSIGNDGASNATASSGTTESMVSSSTSSGASTPLESPAICFPPISRESFISASGPPTQSRRLPRIQHDSTSGQIWHAQPPPTAPTPTLPSALTGQNPFLGYNEHFTPRITPTVSDISEYPGIPYSTSRSADRTPNEQDMKYQGWPTISLGEEGT